MARQNEIKVFKVGSKQADYTVRSITPEAGCKALERELDTDAADKVRSAFRSLRRLGGQYTVLRHLGRKIKVEIAQAA